MRSRSHVLGHLDSNLLKQPLAKIGKTSMNFDSNMAFPPSPFSVIKLRVKMDHRDEIREKKHAWLTHLTQLGKTSEHRETLSTFHYLIDSYLIWTSLVWPQFFIYNNKSTITTKFLVKMLNRQEIKPNRNRVSFL